MIPRALALSLQRNHLLRGGAHVRLAHPKILRAMSALVYDKPGEPLDVLRLEAQDLSASVPSAGEAVVDFLLVSVCAGEQL
jgi:hypothetical protein